MDINFNGYQENVITFIAASGVSAGSLVKMSASGTVTACSNGDDFIGVCIDVRNGYAAVKTAGYTELAVSGDGVSVGYNTLSAAASGIKASENGREYLVITLGTGYAGIIL